jgi:hypothetical protein
LSSLGQFEVRFEKLEIGSREAFNWDTYTRQEIRTNMVVALIAFDAGFIIVLVILAQPNLLILGVEN